MKILFRADASVRIGSGHVMRCLTLGSALREKGANAAFICRESAGNLCAMIEDLGFTVIRLPAGNNDSWLGAEWETDALQTMEVLHHWGKPNWLVVDHYGIDHRWESRLRAKVGQIMVIDDLADRQHDCDLILDQNLHADMESRYEGLVPKECVRLLGPRYALLRPEFARARESVRLRDGSIRKIFIFFGGSDLANVTAKAIEAVRMLDRPDIGVDVVIGAANPNRREIQSLCGLMPNVRLHVQVSNMAELMSEADLAIGAGGSTMWERCCIALPTITISLADNQRAGSEALALRGGTIYLGKSEETSAALLKSALEAAVASRYLIRFLKESAAPLVDGKGAGRIVSRVVAKPIELRRAARGDCDAIYRWRNAEATRRFSTNPAPISYETHVEWYEKMLSDQDHEILIGETDGKPVGVIRYDRAGERAVVSVHVAPGNEGKGIGRRLICEGGHWIARQWTIKIIEAEISPENLRSIAAFEATGFRKQKCVYLFEIPQELSNAYSEQTY